MSNTISICLQIIALILVSLGIIISFISLRIQLKLNLFSDYTKRYQEIMLHLPEEVFSEEGIDYDSETGRNVILYMRAYFDLCSEEFYLSKGHISKKIWLEWESGIKSYFKLRAFKDAWIRLKIVGYEDFSKYVKENNLI